MKKWGKNILLAAALIMGAWSCIRSTSEKKDDAKDNDHREFVKNNYRIFSLAIPDSLSFSGEKVPVEDVEVRERMDRELIINTYWHSQSLFFIKRANRWFPVIEKVLKEEGVPDDFKYLAMIESGFDNVVSPAGATGYWQFLKQTGIKYNLEINNYVDERYNVEKSTRAACGYFKEAYGYLKNWTLVAASYNMGIAGVQDKLKDQQVKSYYDLLLVPETSRYLFRIMAAKEIYLHPTYYGFNVRQKDLYPPLETRAVEVDSSITNLVAFAKSQQSNYKILKYLNPWLRDRSLPNKLGKKYRILFPAEGFNLSPDLK